MALIKSGLLKGLFAPEYDGCSIVNLMASIIRSRGGHSPHRELQYLRARTLSEYSKVVYVVADGVGLHQLERHLAGGRGTAFFSQHRYEEITTVFPATTAAAVTTFATGATPTEHGVLSWFLHLHDLGLVCSILPLVTRTGVPIVRDDFDLGAYLDQPKYLGSTVGRRVFLAFDQIAESRYARAGVSWTATGSFRTLRGLCRQTTAFVKGRGRGVAYVYWPEYDTLCHVKGTKAAQTADHLDEIDEALARLRDSLAGTDTMLLVVADHGLVDTPASRFVDLATVPGLYDCLSIVPSGDARQVSCFVRPRHEKRFLQLVRKHLANSCVCVPGETLLEQGFFGPGRPNRALHHRVGDYVLVARDNYALGYPTWGGAAAGLIGNHGGMSAVEMRVPLFAIPCH